MHRLPVPGVSALGLWLDRRLIGVAAWSSSPDDKRVWRCHVVAVQLGFMRRGYGRYLKGEVVDRARRVGVVAVVSEVHFENVGMERINLEFGATAKRIDRDWVRYIVAIPENAD